jgi:hypothetical protein
MVSSVSLYYCVHIFLTIADNFSFVTLPTLQQRLFNIGIYYEIIRVIFEEQHIKTLLLSNEIFYISLVVLSFLPSAYFISQIRVTRRHPLNFVLRVYTKA